MGILNRTPDSFYDKGATFALDDLVRRAGLLVDQGADLLDVGGVKAGPGPEVGEAEELEWGGIDAPPTGWVRTTAASRARDVRVAWSNELTRGLDRHVGS